MLNDEFVMTYYDGLFYYSYTNPFLSDNGDIWFYKYDHDEGGWIDDVVFTVVDGNEYNTINEVKGVIFNEDLDS